MDVSVGFCLTADAITAASKHQARRDRQRAPPGAGAPARRRDGDPRLTNAAVNAARITPRTKKEKIRECNSRRGKLRPNRLQRLADLSTLGSGGHPCAGHVVEE